jgi:PhoH-like ATPase
MAKKKEKIFVLDTNVLLHDPESIYKFPRHLVIIPVTVLEELDNIKKAPGELGKNARTVIRFLCEAKAQGKGDMYSGVTLPSGSRIKIVMEGASKHYGLMDPSLNDTKILLTALSMVEQGHRVVFVSKDFALRLKAEAIGLEAEDYENLKVSYEQFAKGCRSVTVDKMVVDTFFKEGKIQIAHSEVEPNEYVLITDGQQTSSMARFTGDNSMFVKLMQSPALWGVKPRNSEQKCAVDALLRDDVKLVTLIGPAGTGKTLLALAVGMRKVFDEGVYRKILVSRPIVPLGRDIGYLPGTKEEKLSHWMQPIFDNLELLCASQGAEPSDILSWVLENKKIEMEAVTYIRGRSLPKMYMIIDEAQNLTPHEVKTIISRAGEGTKVILTGDPTQIDNPYLDKDSNGLTYAFGKFYDQKIAASVFLEKTERSELAALAADLM